MVAAPLTRKNLVDACGVTLRMPRFRAKLGQAVCLQGCNSASKPGSSTLPGGTTHSLSGCSQNIGYASHVECGGAEGGSQGCKRETDAAALLGHVEVVTGSVARVLQVEDCLLYTSPSPRD